MRRDDTRQQVLPLCVTTVCGALDPGLRRSRDYRVWRLRPRSSSVTSIAGKMLTSGKRVAGWSGAEVWVMRKERDQEIAGLVFLFFRLQPPPRP